MKTTGLCNRRRIERVVAMLSKEYGSPRLRNKRNPIDELVFVLLSEKTDEGKYCDAYERLKARFGSWDKVRTAKLVDIRQAIEFAGMGRRRAKLIRGMLQGIVKRFGNLDLTPLRNVSSAEAESTLMDLPGVGRKAARCVLLYCFDLHVLPVDIHTYRLAVRLGLISQRVSYEQAHAVLQELVPPDLRYAFHVASVMHGRKRCHAINPACLGCPLWRFCSRAVATMPGPIVVRPRPLAIDLFAGAGGMSLGFLHAGFVIIQAVEADQRVATTYRHNLTNVDLVEENIQKVDPKAQLRKLGLRAGDLTILIGGPPCQGFSESNRRTRTTENPLNHLYREFLRFLDVIQPAWFVLENVAGLRTVGGGELLQAILKGANACGYVADWRELNSAEFGIPQLRRRVFVIGNRLGIPIPFPERTHGTKGENYITVWQAISDLPQLKNGASSDRLPYQSDVKLSVYQKMMRSCSSVVQGNFVTRNAEYVIRRYGYIKPGQNWEAIPQNLLSNYKDCSRCHTGIYYRLKRNEPSKVIGNFRKNMLIHPTQDRGLSVREAARLQSFPDSYEFVGSIGFQQQQVADAVPPVLARAVAEAILLADRKG
jgi:DNA (cytosine-5)-methyltransferase 1